MVNTFFKIVKNKKVIIICSILIFIIALGVVLAIINRSTPEKTLKNYITAISNNERIKASGYLLINERNILISPAFDNTLLYFSIFEPGISPKPFVECPKYEDIPYVNEKTKLKTINITECYIWGDEAYLTCIVRYNHIKPGYGKEVPEEIETKIIGKELIYLIKKHEGWKIVNAIDFGLDWKEPKELCMNRMERLAKSIMNSQYFDALKKQLPPDEIKPADYGLSFFSDYYKEQTVHKEYKTALDAPPEEYPIAPENINDFPICLEDRLIYRPFIDPVSGLPFEYERISDNEFILYAPKPQIFEKEKLGMDMKVILKTIPVEYNYGSTKIILKSKCWVWDESLIMEPAEELEEETSIKESTNTEETINKTVTVKVKEGLNIRTDPSINGDIIGKAQLGDVLKYDEEKNGWYHIETSDGKIGWVCGGQEGEKWVE